MAVLEARHKTSNRSGLPIRTSLFEQGKDFLFQLLQFFFGLFLKVCNILLQKLNFDQ
jgi:hypothetical protein